MNKIVKIRNEKETDYERVEEITRKSFWNLYIPGCNEHFSSCYAITQGLCAGVRSGD